MGVRHARCSIVLMFVAVAFGNTIAGAATKVSISVQEPSGIARTEWPITSGVPFAKGTFVESDSVRLIHADGGKELPLQTRITCHWPDKSVKWLLIDSRLSLAANETRKLVLETGVRAASQAQAAGSELSVSQDDAGVTVSTGMLSTLIKQGTNLPGQIHFDRNGNGKCDDSEEVIAAPWTLILDTPDGHRYTSNVLPSNIVVEEQGALRIAVRLEGQLADAERNPRFRYLVRLHFLAGKPYIKVFVTLIVDVPDQVMTDIRSFKLMVPMPAYKSYALNLGGEHSRSVAIHSIAGEGGEHRLLQADDLKYLIDGKAAGSHAAGWARWKGDRAGVGVGVRHFWQQWPKAISASKDGLAIELIPSFEPGPYDNNTPLDESKWTYALRGGKTRLKIGVAKTHELFIRYGDMGADASQFARQFRQMCDPLLATCEPSYICATKTLGDFPPADQTKPDGFMGYDRFVAETFGKHQDNREKVREYGLLNFGDWWGERGCNWGNLEYDMQRGLIVQYARTGRREYYLRAEEAARHHIDVDVVHAVNGLLKNPNGPPPAVGDIWVHATGHTGGYFGDGAFGMEKPYTLGYSKNLGHVWDRGDFDYYFLSGDERAREVALRIAEQLRIEAAPNFKIGTHIRSIGWPMHALLAAYRATGEAKYLEAVRHGWDVLKAGESPGGGWVVKLAQDHCLHKPARCRGNVTFLVGIVLSALCDYHRETGDADVARTIIRAVDFTLRDTYLQDQKMFRYASCPLAKSNPSTAMFMSESLAYAYRLTKDDKYHRVLQDATETFMQSSSRQETGKQFSQYLIFSPEGLWGLDANSAK